MIVFAGPSVPIQARTAFAGIDWRPPAVAGDFLDLVDAAPEKVLLLDGLFDERASIRHKEAMSLMSSGTRLYGATSMGALRAAELEDCGMVPLGRIASAFRRGLLVGDDEVALVHGDARIGWKAVSVAMVDVRATLCRALRERRVTIDEARALRLSWHDIHYVDRDWPAMIERQDVVARDRAHDIAQRHVRLKEVDARAAIRTALADARPLAHPAPPPRTLFLDRLIASRVPVPR